jgi:hypothetical protein
MSLRTRVCVAVSQVYVFTLSLVRIDVGALVANSLSVYALVTLLLIRTGG